MSLLSTDRLRIALHPDAVSLIRLNGLLRPNVIAKQYVPCPPSNGWTGAISCLASALKEPAWQRCRADIVISAHFLRISMLPSLKESSIRRSEITRLAHHCLSETTGQNLANWRIAISDVAHGESSIACAIDNAMIDALEATMRGAHNRLASLQPYPTAAFDRRKNLFANNHLWYVAVESGCCTLARIKNGTWRSVRIRRLFSNDPAPEIASFLSQERLLAEVDTLPSNAIIVAPNAPNLKLPDIPNVKSTLVPINERRGFSPNEDAHVAIALEAGK